MGTDIVLCGTELILGNIYTIRWCVEGKSKIIRVKLIQVTQYGYNFLYEEENRCILKRHLYVPMKKRKDYSKEKKFFLLNQIMMINIMKFSENNIAGYEQYHFTNRKTA